MLSTQTVGAPGVLDALGAGFAVQDATGTVLQANGTARELIALGLAGSPGAAGDGGLSLPGSGCVDISGAPVPADGHPAVRALRTREPVRGFVMGVHPGTPQARWVRVDSAPVPDGGQGAPLTVATLMIDVTAETERARESAAAADRATRLMAPVADVICRLDATDRFIDVSHSAVEVLGFAPEDLFGRRLPGLVHVQGAGVLRDALTQARVGGHGQALVRVRRLDGELRWMDVAVRRVEGGTGTGTDARTDARTDAGADGPRLGHGQGELHAVLRDVHDRVVAEQARADSDRRYRLLAENTGDLVCVHDPGGRLVYVSPSMHTMLGHRPDEVLGRDVADLVHPDDAPAVATCLRQLRSGHELTLRYRMRRADTGWVWVETSWRPIADDGGELVEIHAASRDVSERVAGDQALAAAEESLRVAFDTAQHGMARLVPDGRIDQANEALATMLGRSRRRLEGHLLRVLGYADDPDPVALLREHLADDGGDELRRDHRLVRADGSVIWVDLTLSVVRDRAGTVRQIVARLVDTTADRALDEPAQPVDENGVLTAAGGPQLLHARLERTLTDPRVTGVALVRVNLDGFRLLNEIRGHAACDRVLVVTAQRLRSAVRESDLVTRLGSDDFAVLCPGVDHDYVERLGQRISHALTGSVSGVGHVSASIGIATARPGDSAADVLSRADAALCVVKRSGGAGWAVD